MPRTRRSFSLFIAVVVVVVVLLLLLAPARADVDPPSQTSAKAATSSSMQTSAATSSNATTNSCTSPSNCPPPCASGCPTGQICTLGVLSSCGSCVPSWCISGNPTTQASSSRNNSGNSSLIGGLVGGMVAVAVLAIAGYIGLRYRKRSKAGLPFFGSDHSMEMGKKQRIPSGDVKGTESWAGVNVGSGVDISHQSAIIPIAYFPPNSNTSSIVVTTPTGVEHSLMPPRPAFVNQGTIDRTSVRSENPFDDLEDEDAVEVKRAVVTKPLRSLPRGPGSTTALPPSPSENSEDRTSLVPDLLSDYMNPTHSMIIDRLSPEAPGGDRDSVASSVIISSGVAKVASASTVNIPSSAVSANSSAPPPLPTAKPTLVRVDTLSRSNSNASRRTPYAATATDTAENSSTSLLKTDTTPAPNSNELSAQLPNLTIQNPSNSTLSLGQDSPFSDRHSVPVFEDEDAYARPLEQGATLLAPKKIYSQRPATDSMASNSTSLYGGDGEITVFWNADDARRSEASGALGSGSRDTLATERVISFAESETSSRSGVRDTMPTERVISLFGGGEEEEEEK